MQLRTGQTVNSADQVTIRPTAYDFKKELVDPSTIRVKVPFSKDGYRFSVEFEPQLMTSYNDGFDVSGRLTTQQEGNWAIHTEPQNSMLIFAEPMPTGKAADATIPSEKTKKMLKVEPGRIPNLDDTDAEVLYFGPGTYFMTGQYHAVLPEQVRWVYLAPGAYVKGAFRFFHDTQKAYKVTGHGVLSGEQYVYEADTNNNYEHLSGMSNCHESCVKMLQFASSDKQQHLDLQGITVAEPPYHSFVVYGNEQRFSMSVEGYKQVGSWYWQTDGIELYDGSTMKNTFFNANDDVLKMYHSNVHVKNTVVWKNENGPVIQWGWTPRTIDDVSVTDTYVIHNRMYWQDVKYNTCILNSSSHWEDMDATNMADPSQTVANMRFENITVEGMTNCEIRIYAMASTSNIDVQNLKIEAWNGLDPTAQVSQFMAYTDTGGRTVTIGDERDGKGLSLTNYTVGGEVIEKGVNSGADQAGRLGFDEGLADSWNTYRS